MSEVVSKLEQFQSSTSSCWREKAEHRQNNKTWIRYSQKIAMKMLDKMEELHLNQTQLAERMECSQQYVSKVLRGQENLSIETMVKIEQALNIQIFC
jgi:ribosome-binding protein aMBF1 (putative translation factor)